MSVPNSPGGNPNAAWLTPWREIRSDRQIDTSPLTDAELVELRAKLNAPGGANTFLSAREQDAVARMTAVRTPEMIAELVTTVRDRWNKVDQGGRLYIGGILHAVDWATGNVREAPITSTLPDGRVPICRELWNEEIAAREVLHRQRESIHPFDHVSGVEATLLWLRAGGDDPPW